MRVKLKVSGIVQGVGFRPFVYRLAMRNCLTGYVRNMGDVCVEIFLEGNTVNVEKFMRELVIEKPYLSQIDQITKTTIVGKDEYSEFSIRKSFQSTEFSGSTFPSDMSICDKCLKELQDLKNVRHNYFFITCTECGPRFTLLKQRPYDRENTTMQEFVMCDFCQKEYLEPLNRRFHAQTLACPNCGPQAYLTTNTGTLVEALNPIQKAGRLLSEGKIIAIKGYGGFHIACSALLEEPLLKIRKIKQRKEKPFAIMARNLQAIEQIAEINQKEQELLTAPSRPIVLLNKKAEYNLSTLIAPNLHNIGVMLPYTGLHYMLFDKVVDNTFVITSANNSNLPIVKENNEALQILGNTVDYFLWHNRKIANRCDDSVMRVHGNKQVFLRRSRGYTPTAIKMKYKTLRHVLGFGCELNNTSCLLLEDKAFISQHIGDIENIETHTFLVDATEQLLQLTNGKMEILACDLHPKFTTTTLANEWADTLELPLVRVQHHHAHAAALMGEHGLNELVGIVCDGYGYGINGEAWGGEVLMCQAGVKDFKRLGHLEAQPLLGGDIASKFPVRVAGGILHKAGVDVEKFLMQNSKHLHYGEKEAKFVLEQLKSDSGRGGVVQSSSCGRVLDAVSAVLGVCCQRSFEGEAAMKLESIALGGRDVLELEPVFCKNILETTDLLRVIYENRLKFSAADLAYSAHAYLAQGLGMLAVEKTNAQGVGTIGFSGGVACNQILSGLLRNVVESAGLKFVVHEEVPAGDGGVSFGQSVVAGVFDF